jgi:carboxypeptidase family protein
MTLLVKVRPGSASRKTRRPHSGNAFPPTRPPRRLASDCMFQCRWRFRPPLRLVPLGVLAALSLGAQVAQSQQGTATLVVYIVDLATQRPVPGAEVILVGGRRSITSDSAGQGEFGGLATGVHILQVRAVGYAAGSSMMELGRAEVHKARVELKPLAYELPPVVVPGEQRSIPRRFAEFERRRQQRMGTFITREDIDRRDPRSLADLLQSVRGIREVCTGVYACSVTMARSPNCLPAYFVDGRESNLFPAGTTPTKDIYGIEVYLGPSETPAEFLGTGSGCGVIAIWTKSAP